MKNRPLFRPSGNFSHERRRAHRVLKMHLFTPLPLWEKVDRPKAETGEGFYP